MVRFIWNFYTYFNTAPCASQISLRISVEVQENIIDKKQYISFPIDTYFCLIMSDESKLRTLGDISKTNACALIILIANSPMQLHWKAST